MLRLCPLFATGTNQRIYGCCPLARRPIRNEWPTGSSPSSEVGSRVRGSRVPLGDNHARSGRQRRPRRGLLPAAPVAGPRIRGSTATGPLRDRWTGRFGATFFQQRRSEHRLWRGRWLWQCRQYALARFGQLARRVSTQWHTWGFGCADVSRASEIRERCPPEKPLVHCDHVAGPWGAAPRSSARS